MTSLKISNRDFSLEIKRKNTRTLKLRLVSSTKINVTAPLMLSSDQIEKFISKNADWILSKALKIKDRRLLDSLTSIAILDQPYELVIRQTQSDSLVITQDDRKIHINSIKLSSSHLHSVFDKKMRPFALSLIRKEVSSLAQKYGLHYSKLSVKNQSSRYGSCSSTGNLNFNWQIIFFPYPLFRHIILHELAHLTHHNHSVSFWSLLKEYDPDFKKHNKWLKKEANGYLF